MANVVDLFAIWNALEAPSEPQTWTATHVSAQARVARTPDGGAAVLVRIDTNKGLPPAFRLRTSHITYTPSRTLSIRSGSEIETSEYRVLECDDDDPAMVRHFLRIAGTLPLDGSTDALDEAVQQIFELFRSLSRRGNNTIQGIWAELLLVADAKSPEYLVSAWHSESTDLHDFVGDGHKVEVKSSARDVREHDFSLEQLEFAPEATTIASILLENDDAGASVFDLLAIVKARVPAVGLVRRAEVIVGKALGDSWQEAESVRFSIARALATLALYSATNVPRPPSPMPAAVSAVRFRADLSDLAQAKPASCALIAALPALAEPSEQH